ncbi:hypothetical protein F0L74_27495 [Chitinophaga agrisoli]|uniref:Uncharacterized protein n=1 Tax=Chitinophaga agrisoli TaxID=2607653 RepID=A0A5B2VK03_9BACT|nr:hypothetical protein [Chitinophaga agrisoli]KAA2239933.1 hypothetical protein F0L74_27495 [Chitinophaga agrisoli]
MSQEDKNKLRREDITGKPDQSEAEIAQTERESHNKGAGEANPDIAKQREELQKAPESDKHQTEQKSGKISDDRKH